MTGQPSVVVTMDGDIARVVIDSPPVNATSTAVRAGLADAVAAVQGARVAILSCAGPTFVAGGDMLEFDRPAEEPHLPDVIQMIEDSPTPFIAVLHGNVLGGGFELALACAWRIATPDTRFGLPEVNVGLIPGAGGTQRAPRLVGMALAVEMACSGKLISAAAMLEAKGLDHVDPDPMAAALRMAADLPERPIPVSQRDMTPLDVEALTEVEAALRKRAKGQQSALHNLTALQWAALPFEQGQPKERALHLDLRQSAESKALRHAFFAERRVGKPSAIQQGTARQIAQVAIVGGGLMGAGIATACLGAGLNVVMIEQTPVAAQAAQARIQSNLDGALKRGKINQARYQAQLAALTTTDDYQQAQPCDLAIEAVFEDISVKQEVFQNLAAVMSDTAILATNTSYLDPMQIFDGIPGPDRCLGLHFFSPAHIMKLLEIVQTPNTDADVLATGFALGKQLRKVSVLSGICDGFIGNRMLAAYRRGAEYLLADGALPYQVDRAMRAFGMSMGPFEVQDLTGLQIAWANRQRQAVTRNPGERYETISDQLCDMDRLGQRSGKGWYRYDGDRTPVRDPIVEDLIIQHSAARGYTRHPYTDADISSRLLAILANEGARIVQEGIAERADDVDMVQIHGYGFPRWRGGPMHYAAMLGWPETAAIMRDVANESPGSWVLSRQFAKLGN